MAWTFFAFLLLAFGGLITVAACDDAAMAQAARDREGEARAGLRALFGLVLFSWGALIGLVDLFLALLS